MDLSLDAGAILTTIRANGGKQLRFLSVAENLLIGAHAHKGSGLQSLITVHDPLNKRRHI